mgnify:CR=1 FL=1
MMYPDDGLGEQLLDTNSIAIPPLPSRCSLSSSVTYLDEPLDPSGGDKEVMNSSQVPFDRKTQSSRPLRPAVDSAYKTVNDCFCPDTLTPSFSVIDIGNNSSVAYF